MAITWSQPFTGTSIADNVSGGIIALTSTRVVLHNNGTAPSLRTFELSGSTWSQAGSTYTYPTTNTHVICAYSSTQLVSYDSVVGTITMYSWNGSVWSTTGNVHSYGTGIKSMTVIAAGVALVDDADDRLRLRTWNGTDFASGGSSFAVGVSLTLESLCTVDSANNVIALIDSTSDLLRTFTNNAGTWSATGSTSNLSPVDVPSICRIDTNKIAYVDHGSATLQAYSWSGSAWSTLGDSLAITSATYPTIDFLSTNRIVQWDTTNQKINVYDLADDSGSHVKYYTGSTWTLKPIKRWNGSAWVATVVKRWNGSSWTTLT